MAFWLTAPVQPAVQPIGADVSAATSGLTADVASWSRQLALALVPDPGDAASLQITGTAPDGQAPAAGPAGADQSATQAFAAEVITPQSSAAVAQPGSAVAPGGMPAPNPASASPAMPQAVRQPNLPPPAGIASADGGTVQTAYTGSSNLAQQATPAEVSFAQDGGTTAMDLAQQPAAPNTGLADSTAAILPDATMISSTAATPSSVQAAGLPSPGVSTNVADGYLATPLAAQAATPMTPSVMQSPVQATADPTAAVLTDATMTGSPAATPSPVQAASLPSPNGSTNVADGFLATPLAAQAGATMTPSVTQSPVRATADSTAAVLADATMTGSPAATPSPGQAASLPLPNGSMNVADGFLATPLAAQAPATMTPPVMQSPVQALVDTPVSTAGGTPAGLVPLTDLPLVTAPIIGVTALATPDGAPMLLARAADVSDVPPQAPQFALGPGLSLSLSGAAEGATPEIRFDWQQSERFWPLMTQPLAQAAGGMLAAVSAREPVQAVSLEFSLRTGGTEIMETPSGTFRLANGSTINFGQPVPTEGTRIASATPQEGGRIAIHLDAERGKASSYGTYATCEVAGAVRIDLAPASVPPLWRPDDTRCFTTISGEGVLLAIAAATMLHRRLVSHEIGLSDLRPGEGFATWDGSPLWLALADIDKPPELGVALSESQPRHVEVWRESDGSWLVERDGEAHRFQPDASDDTALFQFALFGTAPGTDNAAHARARVAMALARHANIAPSMAARAEEAWAAVARHAASAPRDDALLTALFAGAAWQHLRELGDAVLARIAKGDLHAIDREDGIALAVRLGRLRPMDLMETVEG